MLMHTKGILVMTPDSAMVLTGKQSLDFSGGVSAEDNFGIGGYDRVMGPNGQAQYWAPDLAGACDVLMAHYDAHLRRARGDRAAARRDHRPGRPRRHVVPARRSPDSDFTHGRRDLLRRPPTRTARRPFDIRTVMRAVADQDHPTLERWAGMADADTAVVQDAHLGGYPVCLLGHRVAAGAAARLPAHRRPRHLHRRHAVPAVVEEGGAGDQRGERQPAARRAGEPVRLRRVTGLDAQPAAGVRRRDRPGDRQLRRPDRLLRHLALPRRRVRGVLQGAEPADDGAGGRGVLRLGDRRRPRRGRGLRRRGRQARRAPTRACRELEARVARRRGPGAGRLRRRAGRAARRPCGRRSSARWRPSSTRCTASTGRSRSARSTRSSTAPELRPRIIAAIERRPGRDS